MTNDTTHIGLDAHQETIHATVLLAGGENALVDRFTNSADGLRRFARRVRKRAPGPIRFDGLGTGLAYRLADFGVALDLLFPDRITEVTARVEPPGRVRGRSAEAQQ